MDKLVIKFPFTIEQTDENTIIIVVANLDGQVFDNTFFDSVLRDLGAAKGKELMNGLYADVMKAVIGARLNVSFQHYSRLDEQVAAAKRDAKEMSAMLAKQK